jgi:hypothetical protein
LRSRGGFRPDVRISAWSSIYVVTSTFTLAKCVRDHQENTAVVSRVDLARLDKVLTDHDPFKVTAAG